MTVKTNLGLVQWAKAWLGQAYWYGTCCYTCTQSLLDRKAKQYPKSYAENRMSRYRADIAAGKKCTDCIGLIKGYYWTREDGTQVYGLDSRPDQGANGAYNAAKVKGTIATLPELPGLILWKSGHVGVYIGNGEAIEAKGFNYGIIKTKVKRFTVDFLTKRMKTNTGEVPQFYVEGSHEGIICPKEFDMVQSEIERRKGIGGHYSGSSVFSSKLVCADCGAFFGQKVWHSTDKYRKVIWRCNAKFNGEQKCATPHLTEDEIKAMFLKAYNQLMGNREQVIADCKLMLEMLSDHSKLDAQIAKANDEIVLVSGLVSACVHENAEKAQEQDAYSSKYNGLVGRHQEAMKRLEKLNAERADKSNRERELQGFIDTLSTGPLVLDTWDEQLWCLLVVKGIVGREGSIEFEFKMGGDCS